MTDKSSDHARELTELVSRLVESAVHGSYSPAHCHAALRLALRAVELALPPEMAQDAFTWTEGLLSIMPEEVLRKAAQHAISRTPTEPALPPEVLPQLVACATTMLDSIPEVGRTPRWALAALHMAECLVLATQKTDAEKDKLFLELTSIKRMIALVNLDVVDVRSLSKGGEA